jgi:hypothetical protein
MHPEIEDDDEPSAKLIWCVLECSGCALTATETRFTTKGRQGGKGQVVRGIRESGAGRARKR